MTAKINTLKFHFDKTSAVTYNLCLQFFREDVAAEKVTLRFRPVRTPYSELHPDCQSYFHDIRTSGRVVDVYPLNTTYKEPQRVFLKDSMRQADLMNITPVNSHVEELGGTRLLVVDVKDKIQTYNDKQEVAAGEQILLNIFRAPPPNVEGVRKEFIQKLQGLDTTYLICEGSLKADLIKHVFNDDDKKEYFHRTKSGGDHLCQIAELINNAIKVGLEVEGGDGFVFGASSYFRCLGTQNPQRLATIEMREIHHIPMTTFYSPYYHESYGPGGIYYPALRDNFGAKHYYDEKTRITRIDLQY